MTDIAAMGVTIFSSTAGPIGCIRTEILLDFGAEQNTNLDFQDIYVDYMSFDFPIPRLFGDFIFDFSSLRVSFREL